MAILSDADEAKKLQGDSQDKLLMHCPIRDF